MRACIASCLEMIGGRASAAAVAAVGIEAVAAAAAAAAAAESPMVGALDAAAAAEGGSLSPIPWDSIREMASTLMLSRTFLAVCSAPVSAVSGTTAVVFAVPAAISVSLIALPGGS